MEGEGRRDAASRVVLTWRLSIASALPRMKSSSTSPDAAACMAGRRVTTVIPNERSQMMNCQ